MSSAFLIFVQELQDCWHNTDFTKLKNVCIRKTNFSLEFRDEIQKTSSVGEILNVLCTWQYCTWMQFNILELMADISNNPREKGLIKLFKECVHKRKIKDVKKRFYKEQYLNLMHSVTVVDVKVNESEEHKKVEDLLNFCEDFEEMSDGEIEFKLLKVNPRDCMEIIMTIPLYCSLHACHVFKNRLINLRQLHIRHVQIRGFHNRVFVNSIGRTTESSSMLENLLSSCTVTCTYVRKCMHTLNTKGIFLHGNILQNLNKCIAMYVCICIHIFQYCMHSLKNA